MSPTAFSRGLQILSLANMYFKSIKHGLGVSMIKVSMSNAYKIPPAQCQCDLEKQVKVTKI